jgi:hypothetical protein
MQRGALHILLALVAPSSISEGFAHGGLALGRPSRDAVFRQSAPRCVFLKPTLEQACTESTQTDL